MKISRFFDALGSLGTFACVCRVRIRTTWVAARSQLNGSPPITNFRGGVKDSNFGFKDLTKKKQKIRGVSSHVSAVALCVGGEPKIMLLRVLDDVRTALMSGSILFAPSIG